MIDQTELSDRQIENPEMTYSQTIDYLYSQVPMFQRVGASAYKAGLDNTLALDEHLGHAHLSFRAIHVAGTNGKGSVSHTLASILQASGYRVGLYTSPHLRSFRERIRVNGEPVSEAYVVDFVERERPFFEPLKPSFFELTTALAFKYFQDMAVDMAVVEVGLGGRLDCTNIITPLLSVITNISFDHTEFLGDTLPKIAAEKAGIIKPRVPVVVGEYVTETKPVFLAKAMEKAAPICLAQDEGDVSGFSVLPDGGSVFHSRTFGDVSFALGGMCQERNAATIVSAAKELLSLGVLHDKEAVRRGFSSVISSTRLEGRWQRVGTAPLVVCDTGHNLGGWQYLSRQIAMQPCRTLRIVFGMVSDKDVDGVLALLPKKAQVYFATSSTKRAILADVLRQKGSALGLQCSAFQSVKEAFERAKAGLGAEDFIFVGGSSYVVSDFLCDCLS